MSHRASGFTLLELTVATAMTAVLALSLYAAMGVGFGARTSVRDRTMLAREAAIVLDLVASELASALPPTGVLAGPFVGFAGGGIGAESDEVQCYVLGADADAEDQPLGDGIRRVRLVLQWTDGEAVLVRQVQRNLLASVQDDARDEVLARHVRAFGLRYYNGYGWQTQWDSTQLDNLLPLAVEVTVELADRRDPQRTYRMTRIVPLSTGRVSTNAGLFGM